MLSNYEQVARMIPAKHRRFIVENNLIYKAIASPGDAHMQQLLIIWAASIEPGAAKDADCHVCLSRILGNYRELEATLVHLVKEDNLIDL